MSTALIPRGPKARPLVGNLHEFSRDPFGFLARCARDYGDIAHYKLAWNHIVFLNHPDYIREVLVVQNDNFIKERTVQRTKMLLGEGIITSEGEQHRRRRADGATPGDGAHQPD